MGLFDWSHHERNELEKLLEEEIQEVKRLTNIIRELTERNKHSYRLVLTKNINNSNFIIMSLSLAANQSSIGQLSIVDNTSGAVVAATFANVQANVSDATLFSAVVNSDNSITVSGVAAGSGTLSIQADASYTDGNTGLATTQTLTESVDVTVSAVISPEGVTLQVTFSTPQIKK